MSGSSRHGKRELKHTRVRYVKLLNQSTSLYIFLERKWIKESIFGNKCSKNSNSKKKKGIPKLVFLDDFWQIS